MHVLVVLVKLSRVLLGGKPGQALLVHVDSERLVARHDYVDAQVKLVPVDQERISDVARDDRSILNIELIKRLNQMNAAAAGRIGWLDDPYVSFRLSLP